MSCNRHGFDGRYSVRDAAPRGLEGASGALPRLAEIRKGFGRHDVSGVRAHSTAGILTLGAGTRGEGSSHVQDMRFRGYDGAGHAVQFRRMDARPAPVVPARQAGQPDQSASTGHGADDGLTPQRGLYRQVQVSAPIPTPIVGLTIDATLTGRYTRSQDNGRDCVEANGAVRLALRHTVLFFDLSVFLQGSLSFKVVGTDDWDTAFNRAFEDVSRWLAARELADLPARSREVAEAYQQFEDTVRAQIGSLRGKSGPDRLAGLSREDRPRLGFDNALAEIVDARNDLIDNVTGIFSDMSGSIRGNAVYPGTDWIHRAIRAHLAGDEVSDEQLTTIRVLLTREASSRRRRVAAALTGTPAVANDP